MSKYKTIIFDIDDTLIKFEPSVKLGYEYMLKELNLKIEENHHDYIKADKIFWESLKQEQLEYPSWVIDAYTRATFLSGLWIKTFFSKYINLSIEEGIQLFSHFVLGVGEVAILEENSIEILELLKGKYQLVLATVGLLPEERTRLCGIRNYFDFIHCYEDCACDKSEVRYYEKLHQRLNVSKEEMLMVGDSLYNDIMGSSHFGIDNCWYNKNGETNPFYISPTYEIEKISELKKILL